MSTRANEMKPKRPRNINENGLLGYRNVKAHCFYDNQWNIETVTGTYAKLADVLKQKIIYEKQEKIIQRKKLIQDYTRLRHETHDGRYKLNEYRFGYAAKAVRNLLRNNKGMQRLYQKMPIHQIGENIDQRTFTLRKERDRLQCKLDRLNKIYHKKLLELGELKSRDKYNKNMLHEEQMAKSYQKRLENSSVRLQAIQTINNTYEKMLQALKYEMTYYEPILNSLNQDIVDQNQFIEYIVHIGKPMHLRLNELTRDLTLKEAKTRQQSIHQIYSMNEIKTHELSKIPNIQEILKSKAMQPVDIKRYLFETNTMVYLKQQLDTVDKVVKKVKAVTLCSQAKEIYPRMKNLVDYNIKLHKLLQNGIMEHRSLNLKMNRSGVLRGVLTHNHTESESRRCKRIQLLQQCIEEEDKFQESTLDYLKQRAISYVILKKFLWNLCDIMRYVGKQQPSVPARYKSSYLKLPLLKYDSLAMRAYPPETFEENTEKLIYICQRKLSILMKNYQEISKQAAGKHHAMYHQVFVSYQQSHDDLMKQNAFNLIQQSDIDESPDVFKFNNQVPTRKNIKAQSARIVEEALKDMEYYPH